MLSGRQMTWWGEVQHRGPDPKTWGVSPLYFGDNLDALHDVLTEFGAVWTLEFRGEPPPGLREMCEDAMAETPGLVVRFVRPRR